MKAKFISFNFPQETLIHHLLIYLQQNFQTCLLGIFFMCLTIKILRNYHNENIGLALGNTNISKNPGLGNMHNQSIVAQQFSLFCKTHPIWQFPQNFVLFFSSISVFKSGPYQCIARFLLIAIRFSLMLQVSYSSKPPIYSSEVSFSKIFPLPSCYIPQESI